MINAYLLDVPAAAIRLTTANPRTDGGKGIAGLTASIEPGMAQRPTLIEVGPGVFEVLVGERRVRAALAAGWATIPALVEDPLTPIAAHTRRVSENLHRKDLGPLDEARALKLDWLNANAVALDVSTQVDAALADAGSVRAGLTRVSAILTAANWSPSRPAVTQEAYLERRGLGISKAALRKKLQLLNMAPAAEARLDGAGLTEAGIRAFLRLGHADQTMLLDAIAADGTLARSTRTIVGWVLDPTKQRSMPQALAIARGVVPTADLGPAVGHTENRADSFDDDAASADQPASQSASHATPALVDARDGVLDETSAAELVLPLMETAQLVQAQLAALTGIDLTNLPAPWGDFAHAALATITTAMQPFR